MSTISAAREKKNSPRREKNFHTDRQKFLEHGKNISTLMRKIFGPGLGKTFRGVGGTLCKIWWCKFLARVKIRKIFLEASERLFRYRCPE